MQKASVVILNYNGRDYLKQFLPSVIQHSQGYEVVVIDNDSSDDSLDVLKTEFPEVRVIVLDQNFGFSGGYNIGMKQIDAEYLILLNSDVEVSENWITPVVEFMDSEPMVAACQPKILDYKMKTHFEYAGASGGFIDMLGYPFCRGRLFQTIERDTGQYDNNQTVFWASGACLFVRKSVYYEMGGLEEDFFAHMEEIDLCWRLWNSGHKVAVCPSSTVYHVGGGTLERAHPRKTYLNFRNGLSMLLKNERGRQLAWKLPLRIALDWVAAIQFSIVSGPIHGVSILKAHLHFWGTLGTFIKKRKGIVRGKTIPIRYPKLVIWQYYIRRKKRFSELFS